MKPIDIASVKHIVSPIDLQVPSLPPTLGIEDLARVLATSSAVVRKMLDEGELRELPLGSPRNRRVATVELYRFFERSERGERERNERARSRASA